MPRHGYFGNTELQKRLERANVAVRPILEAVITTNEDVKDTKTEWNAADSTTGLTALDDGGMKITGAAATSISVSSGGFTAITDLDRDAPIDVAEIIWDQDDAQDIELHELVCSLKENTGAGKEVTNWRAQMFRVAHVGLSLDAKPKYALQPIAPPQTVAAASGTPLSFTSVTFPFTDATGFTPTVGLPPEVDPDVTDANAIQSKPRTIVVVWALKGEGESASNVSWDTQTGTSTTSNGHTIRRLTLDGVDNAFERQLGSILEITAEPSGVPIFDLKGKSYTAKTVTFSGGGNQLDLGAAPTNTVELVAEGQTPSDTSITYEINDGSGWTAFKDGDRIGETNSEIGGTDLSSLSKQQTYQIRCTLTPNTAADATPIVRRMGVREITREDLDQLVSFGDVSWQVDPVELRGNTPELTVTLLRDGVTDYRDFATELLSDNYIGDLEFRLFVGHPDLSRQYWLHIDDFVIDKQESASAGIELSLVSPVARINRLVPVRNTGTQKREALTYAAQTPKAIYDDLVTGQVVFAGRRVGPGIEATTPTLTRTIKDAKSGRKLLDEVAFWAGGATIASQGRLKFVDFAGDHGPIAVFPKEITKPLSISPGYEERITDIAVGYGYNNERPDQFDGEAYVSFTDAITNLGRGLIDRKEDLDDDIAKWSPDFSTSKDLGERLTQDFGTGLILWSFETNYPHPYLEPGDPIALETDRFVAKDPHSGTALRGVKWALGKVAAVHNIMGTRFTAWVRAYEDILPGDTDITRVDFANPIVRAGEVSVSRAGIPTISWQCNDDARGIKTLVGNSTAIFASTAVRAEAVAALDSDRTLVKTYSTQFFDLDETIHAAAFAYETSTGGGAESSPLFKTKFTRGVTDNQIIAARSQWIQLPWNSTLWSTVTAPSSGAPHYALEVEVLLDSGVKAIKGSANFQTIPVGGGAAAGVSNGFLTKNTTDTGRFYKFLWPDSSNTGAYPYRNEGRTSTNGGPAYPVLHDLTPYSEANSTAGTGVAGPVVELEGENPFDKTPGSDLGGTRGKTINVSTDFTISVSTDGSGNPKLNLAAGVGGGGSTVLGDLGDVTISAVTNNEVLSWNSASSRWENNTAAEAGLATQSHNHAAPDITSGQISSTQVPNHSAAKLTSGTLSNARLSTDVARLDQNENVQGEWDYSGLQGHPVYNNGNWTGAVSWNANNGNIQRANLTGNATISLTNLDQGHPVQLVLTYSSAHTPSFSGVDWSADGTPTFSSSTDKFDTVTAVKVPLPGSTGVGVIMIRPYGIGFTRI